MSNSMKNILPNNKSSYHQSYYDPINKDKYTGNYPIICRSLLEKKFCIYLDNNPEVKYWQSESFSIKYKSIVDGKDHLYYPDFLISINEQKVIVEVKPSKQLIKPKEPKNKTKKSLLNYQNSLKMYLTNISKISAMKSYAENNGYKFILVTEKDMKNFK